MKKYALLIATLIFPFILFAQNWDIDFGESYKKKHKTSLGGDEESSKFLGINKQSYFITYESKRFGDILQFDFNHNLVNTIPIGTTPAGLRLEPIHLLKIKSGNYLISSHYNNREKKAWVYATRFTKDGATEKAKEPLFSYSTIDYRQLFFQGTGIKNNDAYGFDISPDSSKIVFTRVDRSMQSRNFSGNEKYQIFMFDQNLNKLWEKEISLPNVDRKIQVKQIEVSNSGEVLFLTKNSENGVKRKWWIPKTDIVIIRINKYGKYTTNTLRLKKTYPVSAAMFIYNDVLYVTGIYANGEKEMKGASGIFFMKFDKNDELLFYKKYPYEDEIRQSIIPRPARSGEHYFNYEIGDLLVDYKNGYFLFVGENRYTFNEVMTGNLIVSCFSFDGNLEWNFHKKKSFYGYQGSYGLSHENGNIYLIYNTVKTTQEREQIQHKRRPNFTSFYTDIIKINREGKIDFEDTIFHSRERKLRIRPILSKRIYNGNMLLFLANDKEFKYGTLKVR